MLKKIYITLIIVLLGQTATIAQNNNTSGLVKAARKEYLSLKYTAAIKLLERELKEHPDNVEAQDMIADSYRNIKDYDKAVYWYAVLIKAATLKPQWALYYAEALANKQQYESSEQWYNNYLRLVGKDDRASSFVKFYPQVDDFLKNRKAWKIAYLNINTAAAEYSPLYYKNGLIFSSNRKFGGATKRVFEWDQTPFTDLYYVKSLSEIKEVNIDSVKAVLGKDLKAVAKKTF